MTIALAKPNEKKGAGDSGAAAGAATRRSRRRIRGGGQSLVAHAEPIVWLNGAGLVICVTMIVGLLLLVLYQGITTFWPGPLVQVSTLGGNTYLGEVTRDDTYQLPYGGLALLSDAGKEAVAKMLEPRLREKFASLVSAGGLRPALAEFAPSVERAILQNVRREPSVRDAPAASRTELLNTLSSLMAARRDELLDETERRIAAAVAGDQDGAALAAAWGETKSAEQTWLAMQDPAAMTDALQQDAGTLQDLWGAQSIALFSHDIAVPVHRRLFRTGNFELTGEHFNWISDFDVAPGGETRPEWAILIERQSWGRFYGTPKRLEVDGETAATDPARVWAEFQKLHPDVRAKWRQRKKLETDDTGGVNRSLEDARLGLRQVELDYGKDSPEWSAANSAFGEKQRALDAEFARIRDQIIELDGEIDRFRLVMATAQDEEKSIALADVVRAFPANQLSLVEKIGVYISRWWEFLSDEPREANSEGGVLPAIWGTVAMTLLMTVAVVPFGVLAALYLREYAKAGLMVSTVRVAVNNLAGVPSIVFGVFGLGFFCYIIGTSIDELFFSAKLPSPTYGTGGLGWAALTLALLTVPVVIVATEEALAAVPRSMREGSLACGATKFQTIWRIVLPRALPGIMTGAILAMARGAGEVAPLMLVGAVKLAPELPTDAHFPFLHLERSFMHLGFHIYDLGFQSQNSEAAKPMVFTTTLLLIAIIALMNLLAIRLRARLRQKFEYGQF
jgi:phosphate transport system permease protein